MPRGDALSEATTERIWELRAQGLSEREIARELGLGQNTVSHYLRAVGGIRPRPRRRAERCLTLDEREEISRGIARGHSARAIARSLGRSHATVVREIDRCGGPTRYRAHVADRQAWRRSRRPRPRKLEPCPELRRAVEERLCDDHSPERWVSHETIYRALYVQGRGALKRELTRHLRRGRSRRHARSQS
jgi:IS30 family transposase